MRPKEALISVATIVLAMIAWTAAVAAAPPDPARIAKIGNGHGAMPCSACHGVDGGGNDIAGYPRLAGQNKAYLLKQLDDFASGARRHAEMQPNAKAMSPAEREAMAAYYSAMPIPAKARRGSGEQPAADSLGARLATRGRWSRKMPACVQCHGPRGVGVGANFPPLAGQPAAYLANQLKAWQNGTRHNDPLQLMQHVASTLSSDDIRAVSTWFAAQPAGAGRKSR